LLDDLPEPAVSLTLRDPKGFRFSTQYHLAHENGRLVLWDYVCDPETRKRWEFAKDDGRGP
jgi:hypothetical protein